MTEEEFKNFCDTRFFALFKHDVYDLFTHQASARLIEEHLHQIVHDHINRIPPRDRDHQVAELPEISAEENEFYLNEFLDREKISVLLPNQMCINWYGWILDYDPSLNKYASK